MSDIEELETPPEAEAPEADDSGKRLEFLERENEKLRDEAAKRRVENRQLKISTEFGDTVASFVPKDLSLEEARKYAQKLKETFGEPSVPETEAHETQEVAPEPAAPSPLAAVSQPSTGTNPSVRLSAQEIYEASKDNPSRAKELLLAQRGTREP